MVPRGAGMTDLYRVLATVTSPVGIRAEATVRTPGPVTAVVSVDETLSEALLPRTSRRQLVALRVRIDGTTLDPRWITGGMTVHQRLEGLATFSFETAIEIDDERWPLGDPWALRAPPPGLGRISLEGLYGTATGLHVYPLLTDGLVDEVTLEQRDGVDVLTFRGLGPGARSQRRRVSLHLPPDHRTPRGTVVRRLAEMAGVPSISLPPGRAMKKELALDRAPWLEPARQLLEVDGWHLTWDEDGILTVAPRVPPLRGEATATLTARDLVRAGHRVRFRSDVPTQIRLTTEEELLDTDEDCGRVTRRTTTELLEVTLPRRARWRINGNGPWTLDPVVPPSGESQRLTVVQRVVTEIEELCGALVGSVVRTWELKNPEVWRYRIEDDPGGGIRIAEQNRGAYVYEESPDANAEGSEAAFLWAVARLVLTREEFTQREFNIQGLLQKVTVSTKGWYLRRWALKERPADFTDWEGTSLLQPTYTLGNGEGVGPSKIQERYSPGNVGSAVEQDGFDFGQFLTRETTTYQLDGPFVVAETITKEAAHIPPGSTHLFQGDQTARTDRQRFGPIEEETRTYSPTGEDQSLRTTARRDLVSGAAGELLDVQVEDLDSYLPEAERLVDGSDPHFPLLSEARLLESTCRHSALEAHHPEYSVDQRAEWAEDQAELDSVCLRRLLEGALIDAELRLPACFGLRKGTIVHGLLPKIGLRHNVLVTEVITERRGANITTTLKGKVRAL